MIFRYSKFVIVSEIVYEANLTGELEKRARVVCTRATLCYFFLYFYFPSFYLLFVFIFFFSSRPILFHSRSHSSLASTGCSFVVNLRTKTTNSIPMSYESLENLTRSFYSMSFVKILTCVYI